MKRHAYLWPESLKQFEVEPDYPAIIAQANELRIRLFRCADPHTKRELVDTFKANNVFIPRDELRKWHGHWADPSEATYQPDPEARAQLQKVIRETVGEVKTTGWQVYDEIVPFTGSDYDAVMSRSHPLDGAVFSNMPGAVPPVADVVRKEAETGPRRWCSGFRATPSSNQQPPPIRIQGGTGVSVRLRAPVDFTPPVRCPACGELMPPSLICDCRRPR